MFAFVGHGTLPHENVIDTGVGILPTNVLKFLLNPSNSYWKFCNGGIHLAVFI